MAYEKGNRIQYYPNSSNHQHTKVAVIQEVKPNQIYSILPNGESERIGILNFLKYTYIIFWNFFMTHMYLLF
ncbi:hypothetical protein GLOIN_2v1870174 [Rhizophagus irregularis DAOM 181602=DAOM 197198]|uniref:Uncharacterized protein n=1 Tax=Rhizophagus irregularis (strain DAOM 181602 / DAOM 197198 / MUCL 43194) TaxID=747089 RepID=A0A2P4QMF5_RHIID|nr:hypothetical protein GLOIN_2v1870174 [Rhizophagus irregularis DAOM 181602=DAOM 197198]POG78837.1 hypothetical protein GLOIN_2v1870174 [Rhizophagus irregularis DAOM 181602=DAOM 197198]GBC35027.2 hypothetical protein GLOIN_2v1870174 [Rhizophagus irregularis DAOM 181602=DAOM 197198]|eukprot:XP_025185703.1 hypothetical protein GLOIN_2v1870174 [Rhizophagus irregularis DAOM 181602=DAOM 197198]